MPQLLKATAGDSKQKGAVTMDSITAKADSITATRRKGGRTSRWAMKNNRSNTQKATEQTNQNSEEAVPVPTTPALENEGLSMTSGVDEFEDFMVLEGDNSEDKVEGQEAGEPSYNGGSGDGSLRSVGDTETKTTRQGHQERIDGGGESCLNGMVDTWLLEGKGGEISSLTEERERNHEVSCFDYKRAAEQPECANTEDWYSNSCSLMPSIFEYDYWDNWEISVDDQLNHNESGSWEVKQNLLSCLW